MVEPCLRSESWERPTKTVHHVNCLIQISGDYREFERFERTPEAISRSVDEVWEVREAYSLLSENKKLPCLDIFIVAIVTPSQHWMLIAAS